MRVAVDLTSLADHFSGIERFALCVTRAMAAALPSGDTLILVFKGAAHPAFLDVRTQGTVEIRLCKNGGRLFSGQVRLPLLLYGLKADLFFFPAFPSPFLFLSSRSVSAIHDLCCWDCPDTMKRTSRFLFRVLYRKSALLERLIVTVSDFSASRITALLKVPPERIARVYNGVDASVFRPIPKGPGDAALRGRYALPDAYILCLSTLEPRKNLRLLLTAYQTLVRENPGICDLVLAGRKGWLNDNLLSGLDEKCLSKVHVTGFVADADLPALYSRSALFVFPSRYEGFGLPPLEALAAGCEVLSSDAASMPEVLGSAAHYFRSSDPNDLAARMRALLLDPLSAVSAQAKRETAARYVWSEQAAILYGRFQALCGKRKPGQL